MQPETLITPIKSKFAINLREIWEYRELFFVFVWRDIKIRYKQTVIGVVWVLFQPLITTGIFSIFFGKLAKIPSDGLPYPLFALIGLTFWNFFANGVLRASESMIGNEGIIKKVYFPRLIIPFASILTVGVDFLLTFALTMLAVLIYGQGFSVNLLVVIPLILLTLFLTTSGVGLIAASLNISFRDVRHILPFFIQIGLFVTPVIYPLSAVFDYRKTLLMLNPLTSVIETFRIVLIGDPIPWLLVSLGLFLSFAVFFLGMLFFNKSESYLADIL